MDRHYGWARSAGICLMVTILMVGAAYCMIAGENETLQTGSKVEAAYLAQIEDKVATTDGENNSQGSFKKMKDEVGLREQLNLLSGSDGGTGTGAPGGSEVAPQGTTEEQASAEVKAEAHENDDQKPVGASENKKGDIETHDNHPLHEVTGQPAITPATVLEEAAPTVSESVPAPAPEPAPAPAPEPSPEPVTEPVVTNAPVTYRWGSASSYTFRMEVKVTNNGSDTSRNVNVSVPLLENRSPYQTTALAAVNYSPVSSSGRVNTFNIGDLAPGETKTIRADYAITVRPVSIQSSNDTVDKAQIAFNQYAGSGNCRTLARGFISKAREMGVEAREVIGFARPQRGPMTSGSLAGTRHSWAEFYVDGLGWVSVDLTFRYFGELPHASHVVESYSDQSINITHNGGSINASWSNLIL